MTHAYDNDPRLAEHRAAREARMDRERRARERAVELTDEEATVLLAVRDVVAAGRTGNGATVGREAVRNGIASTSRARTVVDTLRQRHLLVDVSKNSAHHWRLTPLALDAVLPAVEARRVKRAELRERLHADRMREMSTRTTNPEELS